MNPNHLYDLLQDYASSNHAIEKICTGLVWTVCQTRKYTGLAMSPGIPTRTLSWPGSLKGKPLVELAGWIREWDPYKATIGMAAVNCSLNIQLQPPGILLDVITKNANLAVFEHFFPQLKDKKIVVIGHYPGIERYFNDYDIKIIERQPIDNDYPDPAAEFLIPDADWVFVTASSITNKTFPRIMQLAQDSTTVLMGPSTPWLPELHEFGVDFLAGVEVVDAADLYQTAAEGGGVRVFDSAVRYRIVQLTPDSSMQWLKTQIAQCASSKESLTIAMNQWYSSGKSTRFPDYNTLEYMTARLSRMDTSYKKLWDVHH